MRLRWFAHVDMDAFYASVEILDRPELAGLPIAVGGPARRRGVIAAASYEARRFGVRSAMPTAQALRLCPELVLLRGRMRRYQQKSAQVMRILRSVAPAVEPLSLDEAAMDLTGCERLHGGDWVDFGRRLRAAIRDRTGLWASVGMGQTRRIAKIASDLRKPRGLVVVESGAGVAFLGALPLARIGGVGPRLQQRLEGLGLRTGADVAHMRSSELQRALGRVGLHLQNVVLARETGRVDSERPHKTISHETTFAVDRVGLDSLEPVLLHLSEKVGARLRRERISGRVVQIKVRDRGFQTFTRRVTLSVPTDSEQAIYGAARRLLHALHWEEVPVRLLGVGVGCLSSTVAVQGNLFASASERERPVLERVLDEVHERFGQSAIERGLSLLRHGPSAGFAHENALDSEDDGWGDWQSQVYLPLSRRSPKALDAPASPPTRRLRSPEENEAPRRPTRRRHA
jgi:DNA polymerase-4